jgi:hypothetical protein
MVGFTSNILISGLFPNHKKDTFFLNIKYRSFKIMLFGISTFVTMDDDQSPSIIDPCVDF